MGIDAPYIQIQCRGIATRYPFFCAPGDVAAIRRHEGSISRDGAALRRDALRVLAKLEATHPHVVRQHQITAGLSHATQALRYSLPTPGRGTLALLQWIRRRQVRGTGAIP